MRGVCLRTRDAPSPSETVADEIGLREMCGLRLRAILSARTTRLAADEDFVCSPTAVILLSGAPRE
jgi:hypothetical protein